MYVADQGNGIPPRAPESLILSKEDLDGKGRTAGAPVRCLSLEMQVRAHTGYDLPPKLGRDLELLWEKPRVDVPPASSQAQESNG